METIAAYVVMPSHAHALIGLREVGHLSEFMRSFKSLAARRIRPLLSAEMLPAFERGSKFQFWKPRFDDLIIRSEKQFRIKTDYIHNNPVKAGLVKRSAEYVLSSAGDWLTGELGIITVDKSWSWLEDCIT